jgi:hypothetical protein
VGQSEHSQIEISMRQAKGSTRWIVAIGSLCFIYFVYSVVYRRYCIHCFIEKCQVACWHLEVSIYAVRNDTRSCYLTQLSRTRSIIKSVVSSFVFSPDICAKTWSQTSCRDQKAKSFNLSADVVQQQAHCDCR